MINILLTLPLPTPCIISNLTVSCRLRVSNHDNREDLIRNKKADVLILLDKVWPGWYGGQAMTSTGMLATLCLLKVGFTAEPVDPPIVDSILLVKSQEYFLPLCTKSVWIDLFRFHFRVQIFTGETAWTVQHIVTLQAGIAVAAHVKALTINWAADLTF